MSIPIAELKDTYIKSLEKWVPIPTWDEEYIMEMIQNLDLSEMELMDYKRLVVQEAAGITGAEGEALEEIYALILKRNHLINPKNVFSVQVLREHPDMNDDSKKKIKLAFASKGTIGPKIEVIHGGLYEED